MLCLLLLQVVGEDFGVVLWRLWFLDAWQSGLLHHLAKVATGNGSWVRLPQHPRAVAGGKKPFCHWISFWRFGLDDGQPPPMFLVSVAWGLFRKEM